MDKKRIRMGERELEDVSLGRAGDSSLYVPEFSIGKELVVIKNPNKVFSRRKNVK